MSDGTGQRTRVYTDGGASPNPGPGGWGVVLLRPGAAPLELAGGETATTNNRMELTAAIRALEVLDPAEPAELLVDSQYVRQGITSWLHSWVRRGWRKADGKPVENEDLWRRLWSLASGRDLEWSWVRGHAGERWNERADELAAAEILRFHGGRVGVESGPSADYEVHLRTSADRHRAGWAATLRGPGEGEEEVMSGAATGTSANRLEVLAAAEVLESLPPGASVVFHTPSDYLRHGASRWLAAWRRRNWSKKDGGPVANRDAWQRLAAALQGRRVHWPDPRGTGGPATGELEKRAAEARRDRST